jgi:hypothetical protein
MCRPQPPRRARRLLAPITSPPVSGFITYGRLAALTLHNEAVSGSLVLQLTGSPREASPDGLLRPTLARLPVEWAIDRVSSFQLTRSARLILALHTSFCDVCDLLAIGVECSGAPGTAPRGAMIAYMPNGGMYVPPPNRSMLRRSELSRGRYPGFVAPPSPQFQRPVPNGSSTPADAAPRYPETDP